MKNNCYYCAYIAQIQTLFDTSPQYICTNPNVDLLEAKKIGFKGCDAFVDINTKTTYVFNKFVSMPNYYELLFMKVKYLEKPIDVKIRINDCSLV